MKSRASGVSAAIVYATSRVTISVSWLTGGSPTWTDVATPQIAPRMDAGTVPVISHVCAKADVDTISISMLLTSDIRILLVTASRDYHTTARCTR